MSKKLDDLNQKVAALKVAKGAEPVKPVATKAAPTKAAKKTVSDRPKTRTQQPKEVGRDAVTETACQEFVLNGGDQSKAYRKAFPACQKWKDKTVHEKASRFFKDGKVQARIAELQEEAAKIARDEFKVDAEYILRRLHEVDVMDIADIHNADGTIKPILEWPKIWRQNISSIEVAEMNAGRDDQKTLIGVLKKIKWPDKTRNRELLGKCASVGAFTENHVHTGADGGPIQIVERRIVRAVNRDR